LLIIVDDLGRQDVGVYGTELYETPNIDRLAMEGVRFDNAYAAHPRCVPSRVAIMSGQAPVRYGVPGFVERGRHALPLSTETFAERLVDNGYQTGFIGKWHLGREGGDPLAQGFQTSILAGPAGAPDSYFYPWHVAKKGKSKGLFIPVPGNEGDYLNDRMTDEALGYIEQKHQSPFMLVLAHYAVHTPIEAKKDVSERYKKKIAAKNIPHGGPRWDKDVVKDKTGMVKTAQNNPVYAAMIESVDEGLGRLMAKLEDLGIDDNTIIMITSDHGGLSSRGLKNKRSLATSNLPYRHGKGWLYEGGIRVPLIVKWPKRAAANTVSQVQVTGMDHYPTILQMAGLELAPKQHLDGQSYLSALQGEVYQRPAMFWHSPLARPGSTGDTNSTAIIEGDWKLIDWYDDGVVELYNLKDDPAEKYNKADENTGRVRDMLSKLQAWKKEVNARVRRPKS
jgi:arylsulfatase A-like enzyme